MILKIKRTALIFLLLAAAIVLSAGSPTPAQASRVGIWKEGVVTEPPWKNTYYYIGINNMSYVLSNEVRILRLEQIGVGQYMEVDFSLSGIRYGDRLKFKAQGTRIHEILVLE